MDKMTTARTICVNNRSCDACKIRRSGIRKELEAFKVMAKFNPQLSSLILISNLEALIAKEEEDERRNGKATDADTVVVSTEPPPESEDNDDDDPGLVSDPDWQVSIVTPRAKVKAKPKPRLEKERTSKVLAVQKHSAVVQKYPAIVENSTVVEPPPLPDHCITTSKLRSADKYIRQVQSNGKMSYECLKCNKTLTLRPNARLHVRRVHFKDRVICPKCATKYYDTNLLGIHFPKCDGVIKKGWRSNHRTEWAAMRQSINQKDNNSTPTTTSSKIKPRGRGVYGAKIVNAAINSNKKNETMPGPSTRSSFAKASFTTSKLKTPEPDIDDDDDVEWLPETFGKFDLTSTRTSKKQHLGTMMISVSVKDSGWSKALVSPPRDKSITFSMDPQEIERMDGGGRHEEEDEDDDYDSEAEEEIDEYLDSVPPMGKSAEDNNLYLNGLIPSTSEFPVLTEFSKSIAVDEANEIECIEIDDDDDDEPDPSSFSADDEDDDDDVEPLPPKLTTMDTETEIVPIVSPNDVLTKIRKVTKEYDDDDGPYTTIRYECVFCDLTFDKEYLAIRHIREVHDNNY